MCFLQGNAANAPGVANVITTARNSAQNGSTRMARDIDIGYKNFASGKTGKKC